MLLNFVNPDVSDISSNECLAAAYGNIDVPNEALCFVLKRDDNLFSSVIGERKVITANLTLLYGKTVTSYEKKANEINFCITSEINNKDAFRCSSGYCLNALNSNVCENVQN